MCVLTYIPTQNNGFLFTSNRDESVLREAALPPRKYELEGRYLFFPKDPVGGGTWIAGCDRFTLCLLNGGLEKHIHKPPYRQSRGRIILDFYKYQDFDIFTQNYQFDGIEPFTLIVIDRNNGLSINELRWTGSQILQKEINAESPHIWSSVTLYSPEIRREREQWFADFLQKNPDCTEEDALNFHHFGGKGDVQNDIKMNRENKLKTLSVTQFSISNENFLVRYQDLQKEKDFVYRIFTECV
ncbi:MAG: NRDE family protein [Emticicia sp.]|nr:NRDE family protein [Emticicia sp.]